MPSDQDHLTVPTPISPTSDHGSLNRSRSLSRELSPREQLSQSSQSVIPVGYLLNDARHGLGEDPSLSSSGTGGEVSYNYGLEEQMVKRSQAEAKKARKKHQAEDAPYRPEEDDYTPESDDSGEEGEGLVRGGALQGRAATRGTRAQRGEGYLGAGLGLRSRAQRVEREGTPGSFRKSPTPVEVLNRALSPRVERRPKRQPGTSRTVLTNIAHGIALTLRFIVEAVQAAVRSLFIHPAKTTLSSSRTLVRTAKRDWWKWIAWLFALSMILRLLDRALRTDRIRAPSDLESLTARLAELEASMAEFATGEPIQGDVTLSERVRRLENMDVSDFAAQVDKLRSRVAKVEHGVEEALDGAHVRAAIDKALPELMPGRQKPTGKVELDSAFVAELRKDLVSKGEVDSLVRDTISSRIEDRLDVWAQEWLKEKRADGIVVSRAEVADRLETEVKALKAMISKARQAPVKVKGDDVTSLLQEMIDAALLRYSKDTLARPDYALFTAGARVIPSITSDTLVLRQPGAVGRWVLGKKPVEGRSPATALHPDNSVGSCWPFAGNNGQLGVVLNRRVKISEVTIEHAAKEVALDTSTAPKEIEVVGTFNAALKKIVLICSGALWRATI